MQNQRKDDANAVLNQYIKHYQNKVKTIKGSGIRRKQRGGNVVFFNDVKQLLKTLVKLSSCQEEISGTSEKVSKSPQNSFPLCSNSAELIRTYSYLLI